MKDCLFCKIINKEIPANIVYENDDIMVILDAFPVSRGHCLVLPKKHFANLVECDEKTMIEIAKATQKTATAILKTYGKGINILSNIHACAGQTIMHAHVHIIPVDSDGNQLKVQFDSHQDFDLIKIKEELQKNI